MNTKQKLADLLENSKGEYLSGSLLAEKLGVTRAAVWKNIRQLKADGYKIEAVTNRGYRLRREQDAVSEAGIRKALGEQADVFTLEMYDVITSTNTVMKERAESLPEWTVIISGSQTAGRGRIGRSFYSPSDSGIYLSVLLRPALPASESTRITTAAAVAACRAIESCTTARPSIKWVNDVFVNGKKVCGILTEGSLNMETGGLDWAVMGIGLDVYEPDGGYPEEIREIVGSIAQQREKNLRNTLAASFLRQFYSICSSLEEADFAEEYKKRSFLIGEDILVLKGDAVLPARAVDIDKECRLLVQYEDGSREALSTGEVSVRPKKRDVQ
ncbi:MAG: biotin--[Oscillospiraceae bacterium]|nr:biotin--[acetyl-CoA-carboxylase] ligase [Oscillospiraceae bacterium]